MSLQDIPIELRALPQWIVWKYQDVGGVKPTKIPYDPKSGQLASVNDPTTWASFDTACFNMKNGFSGIGFVFTVRDPYTFVDLDDTQGDAIAAERQINIYREFDSWSEVSPSGKGLHVIVKGTVPSGRRKSYIEIYSSQRYATFTGNVYNNKPIKDCQVVLTQLYDQMGGSGIENTSYLVEEIEKQTDEQVIEQAKNAVNGEKFNSLFNGQWQGSYPSQSEADFALIDIIAFYTKNRDQIQRIFKASELGKRDKAKRKDYIKWMIDKSYDHTLPLIDFDDFKNILEERISNRAAVSTNGKSAAFDAVNIGSTPLTATRLTLPPGLIGEIAQFIYASAPRPVPEIALAAAIGLMAGICGRAYNISGTGLNQYVLLLANTGTGKEAAAYGIDRIMNSIRIQVPTSIDFVGPSEIMSAQALIKHLNKSSQCFVSILGEFGLRLQAISSQFASTSEIGLRRMLLDLYNKSGHGQVFRPMIYSDKEKNIEATQSPSFSILGESTPERFYGALSEEMISEGLLPRFLIIEYYGPRPPLSHTHQNVEPTFELVDKLASLVANVEMIMNAKNKENKFEKRVININCDPEATRMLNEIDQYADAQINNTDKEIVRQLWNRAHIKVLKLSALIAVGVNMSDPLILPQYVEWAGNMVQSDIRALSLKFDAGEVGDSTSELKQVSDIIRVIKEWFDRSFVEVVGYAGGSKGFQPLHNDRIIPYVYLQNRAAKLAAFRRDKLGPTAALKRTLQILIDSGKLLEITKDQKFIAKYGTGQRVFFAQAKLFD